MVNFNTDDYDDISFDGSEFEKEEKQIKIRTTKDDIIEAIKICLKVSPLIKPSESLINSVYNILYSLCVEDKKYVILEAPTGSGKTIIGFITYFCIQYIFNKNFVYRTDEPFLPIERTTYFLTSSKILQEQIDKDLDRFDFRNNIKILKGVKNYQCIDATEIFRKENKGSQDIVNYSDRSCKGLKMEEICSVYSHCFLDCPYINERYEASEKACTVLNYSYFLNVRRSAFNPYFGERPLTICDEGHLIPDIVCDTFNFEINRYFVNKINKFLYDLEYATGSTVLISNLKEMIVKCFTFFAKPVNTISEVVKYYDDIILFGKEFAKLTISEENKIFKSSYTELTESLKEILFDSVNIKNLVEKRPEDVYYESVKINDITYKHIVKDLNEANLVKTHFLSKLNKVLIMSATLGNIEEYAILMGIEEHEYKGFRLKSTFNFDKSPIYLTKSGYLNFSNFDKNIYSVVADTIKICENLHPKEKGIIHTSTFKICEILKETIRQGLIKDPERYMFYTNSDEKEELIKKMFNSTKPFILIGPSLYEGLDLKDDFGRFNILIKVPYGQMSDYVKRKIERFPFWYKRVTIQKITQAIGRTNRHKNDYSTTYLLDTMFDKIIYDTNDEIILRLKNKRLN